ncbi:hypothetical protein WJX75_002436 [Coccomyxa subellipsoidea]|uniref:CBS domain-containing protein n=1 Tax=Coccomyxa subellipsoidea TaxID=248742 RepID=A0ABR2Z3K3_9CHLO
MVQSKVEPGAQPHRSNGGPTRNCKPNLDRAQKRVGTSVLPSRILAGPVSTFYFHPSQRLRDSRLSLVFPRAVAAPYALPEIGGPHMVDDVMTKGRIFSARVDTPVDDALELMVKYRVSGLPVLDDSNRVVGVVSDYDLLSLDAVSGKMQEAGFFPKADTNWDSFHEVQKLVLKNAGRVVGDVMTENPVVVRANTDMTSAARMLLDTRVRRLPVVDDDGRLVGIFTRGDVIKAALDVRRAAAGRSG